MVTPILLPSKGILVLRHAHADDILKMVGGSGLSRPSRADLQRRIRDRHNRKVGINAVLRGREGRRLRKVGYSKERRVDPQIVVGLLVDRHGFPLEIGCYEGNKAETQTIVPIVKQFQARHNLADMVVVADAGMLSASNLKELDDAGLRFIVGSRVTKAPIDLASHFRWRGDAFSDAQLIDTITPKNSRVVENDEKLKAEPVWDPEQHPGSWRAVWAYSNKRAVRDNRTLTLQENRAKEVVAGEKTAKTPRFVKNSNGNKTLDETSLARARRLVGLKGLRHQHPRRPDGPR